MIVKEEINDIDIDDIGNLEDLLRILFIHEESQLMVESSIELLTKRKSQAFCKLIDVHSVTNILCESMFYARNVFLVIIM